VGDVIDLDAVVPDDHLFKYRGREWRLPGDIDVDTVANLVKITNNLAKAEGLLTDEKTGERFQPNAQAQKKWSGELRREYEWLFAVYQPDADPAEMPTASMQALSAIHATIMVALGFTSQEPNGPLLAAKAKMAVPKKRPAKRTTRTRKSSTPSGGS
jgi:hypothetical protein